MYRHALAALAAVSWLGHAQPASAHAHLVSATPAVNSSGAAPSNVEILFTEELEPKLSGIEVTGSDGKRADTGPAHLVGRDEKRLAVPLGTLPPGRVKVTWHATATDTHKTTGSFTFTVTP